MAIDNIQTVDPIELSINNMYASGSMIVFADGTGKLIRTFTSYTAQEGDWYHTVKIGESITLIAYNEYKDKVDLPSRYWWLIAVANNIKNPLDIDYLIGKDILIPDVMKFKIAL